MNINSRNNKPLFYSPTLKLISQEAASTMALAMPLIMAFLAQKGMQLIDTLMMGWIGPHALAAGALGTAIFITTVSFCRGTLNAVGIYIVRSLGAENTTDAKFNLMQGIYLTLLLALPCMLLTWFAPYSLIPMGENPIVVHGVILLLHGLVWGIPGFLLFFTFREIFAAFFLSRTVMLIALISIPLTFFANYILIYGKFGLPQLGIAGIGYAGAVIMWLMFLGLWFYGKKHARVKEYLTLKLTPPNFTRITQMFYLGSPVGMIIILDAMLFLISAILMGYFGIAALAAHQIALQCASLVFNVPLALSMATSMQVGHALGAQNPQKAKRIVYLNLVIGIVLAALIAIIFLFFPQILARPFLNRNDINYQYIIQLTQSFLIIAGIFQCLDAIQTIASGALRGYKDTWIPMLLSTGCYLSGIAAAYYFAFHWSFGAIGIWYGITLAIFAMGIILGLRLWQRVRSN